MPREDLPEQRPQEGIEGRRIIQGQNLAPTAHVNEGYQGETQRGMGFLRESCSKKIALYKHGVIFIKLGIQLGGQCRARMLRGWGAIPVFIHKATKGGDTEGDPGPLLKRHTYQHLYSPVGLVIFPLLGFLVFGFFFFYARAREQSPGQDYAFTPTVSPASLVQPVC